MSINIMQELTVGGTKLDTLKVSDYEIDAHHMDTAEDGYEIYGDNVDVDIEGDDLDDMLDHFLSDIDANWGGNYEITSIEGDADFITIIIEGTPMLENDFSRVFQVSDTIRIEAVRND